MCNHVDPVQIYDDEDTTSKPPTENQIPNGEAPKKIEDKMDNQIKMCK